MSYYNGKQSFQFTWNDQGQLGAGLIGTKLFACQYNADGLRSFKRFNNKNHYYYYDGDRLLAEKLATGYILFHYDENDSIYAITYNNGTTDSKYYLIKNLQGDVVQLWDSNNNVVAQYSYDAWGNIVTVLDGSGAAITDTTHIAHINPIRYRSYYYDIETGFYYLQSRYYDPAIGRFISADKLLVNDPSAYGYNLFAYCGNDPVNNVDPSGQLFVSALLAVVVVTVCIFGLTGSSSKKSKIHISDKTTEEKPSFSFANHVSKAHVTSPTAMIDLGTFIGKVGFSTTTTKQNKEPGLFHSYSDIGNDSSNYGAGINAVDLVGIGVGVSSEINAYVNIQVTPWVHGKLSLGVDGIGAVIGVDIEDTAYDFEVKGGWGLGCIIFAPQLLSGGYYNTVPAN